MANEADHLEYAILRLALPKPLDFFNSIVEAVSGQP